MQKKFRKNVAGIIVDDKGLILACRRCDQYKAWQLPQGGVDSGEDLLDAFYRELREEIGTDQVELIGSLEQPIRYDWPEHLYSRGYHGQEQYYFLARLLPQAMIDLNSHSSVEFDLYQWLTLQEFSSRIEGFKREAYIEALTKLSHKFPGAICEL